MQFAPDGEHIATTGGDGAIRVWSWRADRLGEPPPNGESLTMLGEIEDAHGGKKRARARARGARRPPGGGGARAGKR